MESEDERAINPTKYMADYVKCENTNEVIKKLLTSDVAKQGVDHNLYPISKFINKSIYTAYRNNNVLYNSIKRGAQ